MKPPRIAALVLVLTVTPLESLLGQSCWRGRPLPDCRSFWITENGPRLGSQEAFGVFGTVTAFGHMRSQSDRRAIGGTLQFTSGSDQGTYRLAIMPRYRRWISRAVSADVGVGVALLGEGESAFGFKGVSVLAALDYADIVAITADLETRHGTSQGTQTAATLGVRFGSYLGPVAATASLVLGLLAGDGS